MKNRRKAGWPRGLSTPSSPFSYSMCVVHNKIKQKHLVNNEDECIPSDDLCFFNFFSSSSFPSAFPKLCKDQTKISGIPNAPMQSHTIFHSKFHVIQLTGIEKNENKSKKKNLIEILTPRMATERCYWFRCETTEGKLPQQCECVCEVAYFLHSDSFC